MPQLPQIRSKVQPESRRKSLDKRGIMGVDGEGLIEVVGAYDLNKQYGLLSEEEVLYAVQTTKLRHSDKLLQFIDVNFYEPSKEEMFLSYTRKRALLRRAEVITFSLTLNQTIVDIVILPRHFGVDNDSETYKDEKELHGSGGTTIRQDAQPGLSPDEYAFVEVLCKSYEPLLDAIAARGLDPEGLRADAWCVGHTGPDCDPTERVCWPSLFYCGTNEDEIGDLIYARPIEGIEIRISLTHRKIIRFEDNSIERFPLPGSGEGVSTQYIHTKDHRPDLKPIVILQPEGPSFTVTDINTVTWQSWKFQVGFNSREGATLHGISYSDRPILHKMSFCEMVRKYFLQRLYYILSL